MKTQVDRVGRVEELPDEWDGLAAGIFQKRAFLRHCQEYNPCRQRYYLLAGGAGLLAGAVVYSLRLDLLTFLGVRSPVNVQIVGLPCSVSCSSLLGPPAAHSTLLTGILAAEKGLVLCLNLDFAPPAVPAAVGRTWPSVVVENRFGSWEEYVASLRSAYRRRVLQICDDAAGYTVRRASCSEYTADMHAQYEEVHRRSRGKLEKLSVDFFRRLPEPFRLTTFASGGAVRGWTVTLGHDRRWSFFLGGQDYTADPERLYLVKLLDVVRTGIAAGAAEIDLGQSAEVPKMRMGGQLREKTMLAGHGTAAARALLGAAMPLLSYRTRFPATHPFRGAAA